MGDVPLSVDRSVPSQNVCVHLCVFCVSVFEVITVKSSFRVSVVLLSVFGRVGCLCAHIC